MPTSSLNGKTRYRNVARITFRIEDDGDVIQDQQFDVSCNNGLYRYFDDDEMIKALQCWVARRHVLFFVHNGKDWFAT
jgi:hypothetical protein